MTSRTPRRHRRLALMAAGTAAAMILVPGTALAQDATPLDPVVNTLQGMASQISGAAPAAGPSLPSVPGGPNVPGVPGAPSVPNLPGLPGGGGGGQGGDQGHAPVSSDDSDGHTTPEPQSPDHGSGHVGLIKLTDKDILNLTRYDATVEKDGTTHSDSEVLGLLGNQVVGSSASSSGANENGDNPTAGIGKATNGAINLALLYHNTAAFKDATGSTAGARGGVLALCLGGNDPESTTSYECKGQLGQAGVAEGLGLANRDKKSGQTDTKSANETANACLLGTRDSLTDHCSGLLGVQALHSDSHSNSAGPDTSRHSYLLGFDSGGNQVFQLDQPAGLALPPGCGSPSLLCLFLNQGRSFLYPNGASSGQEALDLNLLKGTPLDILVQLGQAETIAHKVPGEGPGGNPPECSDKIDNDGDGKIDYPADPDCTSPSDNSEAGNGGGNGGGAAGAGNGGGLASTGADIAPLLAGAFLLIGAGSLTVAATRRRVGKHTV